MSDAEMTGALIDEGVQSEVVAAAWEPLTMSSSVAILGNLLGRLFLAVAMALSPVTLLFQALQFAQFSRQQFP
jgi:formate/nitrite transporter FocA (FNT family)